MSRTDAWACPRCRRLVPRTIDVCRCGRQRTGTEAAAVMGADAPLPTAAPDASVLTVETDRPAGPVAWWMVAAAVVLLAVAAAVAFSRRSMPPASPEAPPSAGTMANGATPDDRPSGAKTAAGPTPQWPSDPALWKQQGPSGATSAKALSSREVTASTPQTLEDVVSVALPAVVLVETTDGRGTGFFVSADTVITNAHVVEGATYVTLRSASGEETPAVVVTRSNELDLAALHVARARPGQASLPLGDSGEVRVGQEIVAIGSPMGLQNTVTRGIVSSLRRVGAVMLVQTDAAINPGNSGGPLLDHRGRVVAVATMKITGQAESLGFGVAAEHVRALLEGRGAATPAGRRPVDVLNSTADADSDHNDAAAGYERVIAEAAKRADQLDRSWADLVGQCLGGATPGARGERGWFAVWEGFDGSRVSPACANYFADFKNATATFRQRLTDASDAARRAGVYPGEGRDIRHRYRLDSPDW